MVLLLKITVFMILISKLDITNVGRLEKVGMPEVV